MRQPLRLLMAQLLQSLTGTTTILGFDFQNWMLIVAAILVFWVFVLARGAK